MFFLGGGWGVKKGSTCVHLATKRLVHVFCPALEICLRRFLAPFKRLHLHPGWETKQEGVGSDACGCNFLVFAASRTKRQGASPRKGVVG